jgi:hypothetical protein
VVNEIAEHLVAEYFVENGDRLADECGSVDELGPLVIALGKDTGEQLKTETEPLPQAGLEIECNFCALDINQPCVF